MKKLIRISVGTLLGIIGLCFIGFSFMDVSAKTSKAPESSKVSKYDVKGEVKSLTAVPIHDNKHGNVKPKAIQVYTKEGQGLHNISELGQFKSSDGHHQFGTWKPKVSQKSFEKAIADKDVYFKVTYDHNVEKWYKVIRVIK